MKKVYIETYGCTLNSADSDILSAILKEKNYEIVDDASSSDVVVVNTCTVKGTTENKIRERVRSLVGSDKPLVIAGCMSANEKRIRKFAPNSPILGTSSLSSIVDAVESAYKKEKPKFYGSFESKDALPKIISAPIMRIPINDGCTSSCNFCQTKLARPFLRSYTPKTIVKWIHEAVNSGAREIQLTSMDSGAYGLDIKTNLPSLLDKIANDDSDEAPTSTNYLVRLGMINPNHAKRMVRELSKFLNHFRFYKFLHLPLQSGSEKVCKEMNRDHSVEDYLKIAQSLYDSVDSFTLSTDIIVGYPTESDSDFEDTLKAIEKTKPSIVNVSRFSPRPGTKAKELPPLPNELVKERVATLNSLLKPILEENRRKFVGKTYPVLVTEKSKDYKGRLPNYLQVVLKDFNGELGTFVKAKIVDSSHNSLFGEIINGE